MVTKKENQLLREFQMANYDMPWQTTYAEAGVTVE
jgi:hypothetical protein